MNKIRQLIKTLIIFVAYLTYTLIFGFLLESIGINNQTFIYFIADFIFLFSIFLVYKNDLREALINLKKNFSIKKLIFKIILWVIIIFGVNILGGIITEVLLPGLSSDNNSIMLQSFEIIYMAFKTLIFAIIAEELVFKKSVREVVSNKILFIILSSVIYAIINIGYSDWTSISILPDLIGYFLFACITSILYIKYDNIILVMLVKFCYNLIPFTILLLGLGS